MEVVWIGGGISEVIEVFLGIYLCDYVFSHLLGDLCQFELKEEFRAVGEVGVRLPGGLVFGIVFPDDEELLFSI